MTKHHEWLQAQNCWFVPVVAATTVELHPESLQLLYDFARLKKDAAEQTPEQLCQRRGATFPPGRSYTAHWEVLGCALCLLTARAIPRTGPVWGPATHVRAYR